MNEDLVPIRDTLRLFPEVVTFHEQNTWPLQSQI